ncbi:AbrB family transcriptional regulator [Phormidium sp. LEGE 05292]|uniref:AbrB family transcriptional regulator n=1 Tax=[Phormidium] sp. LEGE 05292 TaxID=767427 RepID=UPI00187F7B41|nr:AbrB family transcriptional regulator [Phormidium sp. LEGE 05292]MBE9227933.1 AbrB family transcriptional regulator [Phormidium sp. LEGE 05292]
MNNRIAKNSLVTLGVELLLSLPLGFAFGKIFPIGGIAWIFGGIAAGALTIYTSRFTKWEIKPHPIARKIGQALVGTTIGFSITNGNLEAVYSELPTFLFLTLFIMITGVFTGWFFSKVSRTNIFTAMLATTPGGVGIMSSFAAEYNKDVSLVSLVQVIRVTSVVIIIPILARSLANSNGTSVSSFIKNLFPTDTLSLLLLIILLICTFLVVQLAKKWQIPTPFFFGALLVGISFSYCLNLVPFLDEINFTPPYLVNLIGQALLGISIGESWGNNPKIKKRTIFYALIPVSLTIVAGFIAAGFATLLTPWDWLTCMLVTAPGGAAEMILVALSLNHNVEVVTAGHLIRLIALNASLPLWLLFFRYLEERVATNNYLLRGLTDDRSSERI